MPSYLLLRKGIALFFSVDPALSYTSYPPSIQVCVMRMCVACVRDETLTNYVEGDASQTGMPGVQSESLD